MEREQAVIVVAGYHDPTVAGSDFHELNRLVRKGSLEIRSAALVTRGADGTPSVVQAANHHGRIGAGWGAGAGFLVGLFVPPLAVMALVGAVAGALTVAFTEHELKLGLRREIGEALEAGTAVVLTLVHADGEFFVGRALSHASRVSVLPIDETTVSRLDQAALAAVGASGGDGPDTPVDAR